MTGYGGRRSRFVVFLTTRLRHPATLALVSYAALTVLLFWGAWRAPRARWIGQPGDPPIFMWFLRWTPYALAHGLNPAITHHLNYPTGVNLMWNTWVPLAGVILTPVTLALGPTFSYNLFSTMAVVLSAWCAFVCFRRHTRRALSAWTGGLLYGFSPYTMAHALGHPNLSAVFVPPLLLVVLEDTLVRQHRSVRAVGAQLGALAAIQLLLNEELLATEAIVSAIGLVVLVALHPDEVREKFAYAARALALGLGVFLAISLMPLAVEFLGPHHPTHGSLWGPDIFVSDIFGFVVPTGLQQLRFSFAADVTRRFTDSCCPADSHTYMGIPLLLALLGTAIVHWRRSLVRWAAVVALAVAVLSLGPHLHVRGRVTKITLPARLLIKLPLLSNVLVSRMMVFVYLLAALLVAVLVDATLASRDRTAQLNGCVTVAMVALFLFPKVPFPSWAASTPEFFRSNAVNAIPVGTVALVAPFARDTSTSEPMLWQAVAAMRFRMVESYALGPDSTGKLSYLPIPDRLSTLMRAIQDGEPPPVLDDQLRTTLLGILHAHSVATVIVGPMGNRTAMVEFFRSLLREEPTDSGGVQVWLDVGQRA